MKILVYGINYYPELTGIGKYTAEMCEWLAAKGHQVTVITSMPYYPNWKVSKEYRRKLWHTEIIRGVTVCRSPLYIPKKITGITRMLHEFSFVVSSLFFWIPTFFRKYDVAISICPPFHLGFISLLYQWVRNTPVIYHVQDLQVDAARNLNILTNQSLITFMEKSEFYILRRVRRISSISVGMKRNILNKGISSDKYIHLPNWVDVQYIKPLPVENSLKTEMGFDINDKIVLYSGNLGEKQGLSIILEVAEILKERESLFFVMVGEGPNKTKLMQIAKSKGLKHISFFPLQPYHKLASLLAIADIHLVLQKQAAADLLLPSKLMTLLAAGGLAVVTADEGTTLYDIVHNNNMGIVIPPENTEALKCAIESAIDSDNTLKRSNARRYAERELNIEAILSQFEMQLIEIKGRQW